jgi:hypothetical protein
MSIWNKKNTGKPDLTDNARASIDLIADRIDNLEKGLAGDDNLTTIDINGGTIDGTPIGGTTPSTGKFTDLTANGALNITGSGTVSLTGTTDIDIITNADDINLTSTSGDINLDSGTGRTKITKLFVKGADKTLNETNLATKNIDVEATKDIILVYEKAVLVQSSTGTRTATINIYSDNTTTPTTLIFTDTVTGTSATTFTRIPSTPCVYPITKGDYYRIQIVNNNNSINTTVTWREIEIGA